MVSSLGVILNKKNLPHYAVFCVFLANVFLSFPPYLFSIILSKIINCLLTTDLRNRSSTNIFCQSRNIFQCKIKPYVLIFLTFKTIKAPLERKGVLLHIYDLRLNKPLQARNQDFSWGGGAKKRTAGELFFLVLKKSNAWFVFTVVYMGFFTLSMYAIKTNLFNKCLSF